MQILADLFLALMPWLASPPPQVVRPHSVIVLPLRASLPRERPPEAPLRLQIGPYLVPAQTDEEAMRFVG